MQKHVNLVDLVKSFPTNIYLQNLASIQKRTSPLKFVQASAVIIASFARGSLETLSSLSMFKYSMPFQTARGRAFGNFAAK